MKKFELSLTDEQIARSKARQKAIDELEYNPMCYDCKKFKNSKIHVKDQKIRYIAAVFIKKLIIASRLYMHKFLTK